ncbi:MAG: hypothetical protein ACOH1T_00405 [Microbacteriaceae bacterium]
MATRSAVLPRPKAGEVRVRLGAVGMTTLGLQATGLIEAVGPEAGGFAPGDRVAYSADAANKGMRPVMSQRDLISFPKDVSLDQAAALLPLGLIARTIVRQLHSIGRGNTVAIAEDPSGAHTFVRAWIESLGARAVEGRADIEISDDDYMTARRWRYGHGIGQQAASDVFEMMRRGVFDGIPIATYPLSDALRARSELAAGPVVLLPADVFAKAA